MTRLLFIYWKTGREQAAEAAAAMADLHVELAGRHAGLLARLYRRADEAGDAVTLMATYACPGGIAAPLQAEIVATGNRASAPWCRGARHVEVFEELHVPAGAAET